MFLDTGGELLGVWVQTAVHLEEEEKNEAFMELIIINKYYYY